MTTPTLGTTRYPSLPRRILMAVLGIPRPTVRRAARGEEVKAPTEPDA
jgi:hypothetical protein